MIERNSKHIHLRSVLNRKIKLLSEGVALSPMMYVTKQYAIAICKVGGMRYTVNDGCFHRHIQMRQNSDGILVKKLFDEHDLVGNVNVENDRIVDEDKFNCSTAYEIE